MEIQRLQFKAELAGLHCIKEEKVFEIYESFEKRLQTKTEAYEESKQRCEVAQLGVLAVIEEMKTLYMKLEGEGKYEQITKVRAALEDKWAVEGEEVLNGSDPFANISTLIKSIKI